MACSSEHVLVVNFKIKILTRIVERVLTLFWIVLPFPKFIVISSFKYNIEAFAKHLLANKISSSCIFNPCCHTSDRSTAIHLTE